MIRRNFTLLCAIILFSSTVFFLWAYNASMNKLQNITCNARYDFFMGTYSLNSSFNITMTKNQGNISLMGDYYENGELRKPFHILSNYSVDRNNKIYSVKMQNSFINPKELPKDPNFAIMINGLNFKEGALVVYQILNYGDENYIFLNGGRPLFICQAML